MVKARVIKEYKKFAAMKVEPQEDWDLIWVLSGPETSIADEPAGKKERNITRERLLTAFALSRRVAALRSRKKIKELTIKDILRLAPSVYYNGTDGQNKDLDFLLHDRRWEQKYNFPVERIKISPALGIQHTGDQFKTFPKKLVNNNRRIVLVTSLYHLPRVKRYFGSKYNTSHISIENIILVPAEPRCLPVNLDSREVHKMQMYEERGILPKGK